MTLRIPEILLMPEKMFPIITKINDYSFFLAEGGRGGGKSHAIGRYILYLCEQSKIRVVCGREVQNSINESVYSLLSDLIIKYNLNFEIQSKKIMHRSTGSEINFRGFREQGSFNIQGMEGIDVTWVDEAQALTKQTLDRLIPTILRKANPKIFFTMNRHVPNDPVFERFAGREDCLHIHINYVDNPYCPAALIKEAEECKKKSKDDYDHIWMGEPLSKSEDAVFALEELNETSINRYQLREGYGLRLAGFDVARYGDDKCACVVIQQMGALHWEVIHVEEWDHQDLSYTTGRILALSCQHEVSKSIIDEDGIGAGPLDMLNKGRGLNNFLGFRNPPLNFKDNEWFGNNRTANTYKVKEMVQKKHLVITDRKMIQELIGLRYTFDHMQRKILISKDVMRTKFKVKSPNTADALIMAVSLINAVKVEQDNRYVHRHVSSREENLFAIAGV